MKNIQWRLCCAALAVWAAGAFMLGCSENPERANASQAEAEFTISVKVAPVVRDEIRSTISAVGAVKALNQAKVSAKIAGKVERILAEEGEKVEAGQTLLELEKTDLILTVRQAEAALAMARANFSRADTNWTRSLELFQSGICSQEQHDLVKSNFEVAQASVKQAEADLGLARSQLDSAEVTTLFGGVVTHRYVDKGERIQPGQPLFEVADIDPVEVEVGISDKRFSQLRLGQPATIMVDGYPELEFEGKVKRIQPAIDPLTRTFKVILGVENPDELLKPGMFARAAIEVGRHPDALVIPKAASLEEEGRYFAVVVRENRAHRVEIQPGFLEGERLEVVSGLEEGDRVVIEGAYGLGDGAAVRVSEG